MADYTNTDKAAISDESQPEKSSRETFSRGNYLAYYGYRNAPGADDPRLQLFTREMFEGKDVLDVGCNMGHVTLSVARNFSPRRIVGIDVDRRLIAAAKRNIKHCLNDNRSRTSLKDVYRPVSLPSDAMKSSASGFPQNVMFQVVNI